MVHPAGRPPRRTRAVAVIGTSLLILGSALLLAAAGLQLYTVYAQTRWDREKLALSNQFLPVPDLPAPATAQATHTSSAVLPPTATASLPLTATPSPTLAATQPAGPVATTPTPTVQATSTPRPSPTNTAKPSRPIPSELGRLLIPTLTVDALIVTIPLVNGLWDASKIIYDVGWLAGTGFPGQPGNAAMSGHVSLKGRGDGPFRWLERLANGDSIIVQQDDTRYTYRVSQTRIVLPTDVSVLAATEDSTLTLITCTDWDFLRAEYSKRLIVTATLASQRQATSPGQ